MLSAADKAWVAGIIGLGCYYIQAKFGVPISPELAAFLTAAGVYWTPNKSA
jgi:hypothetical protein